MDDRYWADMEAIDARYSADMKALNARYSALAKVAENCTESLDYE